MFAITFPMAQQILPYFIRETAYTAKITLKGMTFPGNWHIYLSGIIFSIVLLITEYILLLSFTKYILSTNIQLI
jgi:hypothetical protein